MLVSVCNIPGLLFEVYQTGWNRSQLLLHLYFQSSVKREAASHIARYCTFVQKKGVKNKKFSFFIFSDVFTTGDVNLYAEKCQKCKLKKRDCAAVHRCRFPPGLIFNITASKRMLLLNRVTNICEGTAAGYRGKAAFLVTSFFFMKKIFLCLLFPLFLQAHLEWRHFL
jgi:hypothetical protein